MIERRTWTVAHCDYPGCEAVSMSYTLDEDGLFYSLAEEGEWLLLSDDDDRIRCFCPAHLRHERDEDGYDSPVEYDPDRNQWPADGELVVFYEKDVLTHPLPLPECENLILSVLKDGRR